MNAPSLPRTAPRTLLATVAAALVLVGTSACGADDLAENAAEGAVERALEQAAESEGGDVDVDLEEGSVSIESSDGTFTSGLGDLPDGFPEDVPLLEGEVLQGASSTDDQGRTSWVVTLSIPTAGEEALAAAAERLEDAGYTAGDGAASMEGLSFAQYRNGEHDVVLGAIDDGEGGTLLSYTVGPPTS